ncbi:MAG: NADH-quinone oxidoreductase subunit C [Dehalococcoidia bacterium]|nr:NADH-quinone oxidoreductase subunit C [Dehalococcoidia bacterium]
MSNETATAYPGVAALVHKHLGKIPFTASKHSTDVVLHVAPDHFLELVRGLKERRELAFDFLRNVTAIDMTEEGLRAVYHFYSFKHHHSLQVDVNTPPGNPHIPSLTALYSAANWHEREAAEMVGLVFDGHPNPKNLLLDEDVRIHPLLKAHPLQKGEFFQGIEDTSAGFKF